MNLNQIQQKLSVPKNQRNNFGNYNYRSCEDILEAVKPLLEDSILTITDEVVNVGDRYYVKATATLSEIDNAEVRRETTVSAYAREAETKKGMDEAQITGSASSYARKYALNGLFAIDDTKDSDTNEQKRIVDNAKPTKKAVSTQKTTTTPKKELTGKCAFCGALSGHSPLCPNHPDNLKRNENKNK